MDMKNFSTQLILIALLFVVGPTIHKMVMAKQQKGTICAPISEIDQSSFDEETENSEYLETYLSQNLTTYFHKQISFRIETYHLPISLADKSFSPPPI